VPTDRACSPDFRRQPTQPTICRRFAATKYTGYQPRLIRCEIRQRRRRAEGRRHRYDMYDSHAGTFCTQPHLYAAAAAARQRRGAGAVQRLPDSPAAAASRRPAFTAAVFAAPRHSSRREVRKVWQSSRCSMMAQKRAEAQRASAEKRQCAAGECSSESVCVSAAVCSAGEEKCSV